MKVAVVVDSSAGLPSEVARGQQITVVPLSVTIDGRPVPETEVGTTDVLDRLAAGQDAPVDTPGREAFAACYRALAEQGIDEVVSVHPPQSLSPTVLQARGGADQVRCEAGIPVHVVDGQVSAMGLGWVALTAAGAAASGMTGAEVRDLAVMTAARSLVIFAAGEPGRLQRLGRLGARRSLVGTAMGAQPVFRLQRGELSSAGTPLSLGRALDRIVEITQDNGRGWPVHLTVQHAAAPQEAHVLRERLLETDTRIRGDVSVVPVPPVVAAHTGAGTVGLAMAPTDWITSGDPTSTPLS